MLPLASITSVNRSMETNYSYTNLHACSYIAIHQRVKQQGQVLWNFNEASLVT